jgi:hypothetical protein
MKVHEFGWEILVFGSELKNDLVIPLEGMIEYQSPNRKSEEISDEMQKSIN